MQHDLRLLNGQHCRSDIDSDSSIPATPSVSTPSRLRPLSSALEERANSLSSAASSDDIPSAQDLQPSNNPAGLLSTVLQQLQQANIAKRKELDWQTQNQVCLQPFCWQWVRPHGEPKRSNLPAGCMSLQALFIHSFAHSFACYLANGSLTHSLPCSVIHPLIHSLTVLC